LRKEEEKVDRELTASRCDSRMEVGINQKIGTNKEVREAFDGWDPRIDRILGFVDSALEWRVSSLVSLPFQLWIGRSLRFAEVLIVVAIYAFSSSDLDAPLAENDTNR